MDPEVSALAGSAATTIVTLMATDAWRRTREGVVALWTRVRPERADAVDGELEATRNDLLAAGTAGDSEAEEELRAEWRGRLRRLLAADPSAAGELRLLMSELDTEPTPGAVTTTHQHASATGRARVYQAGRDQHIHET